MSATPWGRTFAPLGASQCDRLGAPSSLTDNRNFINPAVAQRRDLRQDRVYRLGPGFLFLCRASFKHEGWLNLVAFSAAENAVP
jgi:hypothetical protein